MSVRRPRILPFLFLLPFLFPVTAQGTSKEVLWVFFKDRGVSGDLLKARLDAAARALPAHVRWRRGKVRGPDRIVDEGDLPVSEAYIERVLALGAVLREKSRWFNAISIEVEAHRVTAIEALPFVDHLQRVGAFPRIDILPANRVPPPSPSKVGGLDYGASYEQLHQINIPVAHLCGNTGEGVIVGMLDTGFRYRHHPALSSIDVIGEYDFINDDRNTENEGGDPPQQDTHGTMTLSVIGGYAPGTLIGGAYGARFLLAKTEDTSQEAPIEEDYWVAGIEWLERNGADIVSSSLAYTNWYSYSDMDGETAITTQAANRAWDLGVVVVNAMGNYGNSRGSIAAPADGFGVLSIGAVDSFGNLADFSSVGPTFDGRTKPDLVALGVSDFVASPDGGYTHVNGTSFSCPLIASAAALLLSAHPRWTPDRIRNTLHSTADRADDPDNFYGWGLANVAAALGPCEACGSTDTDGDGVGDLCDEDRDGDGYIDEAQGGDDCDDTDPSIHPGAYDRRGDGIDKNCNGNPNCALTASASPSLALPLLLLLYVALALGHRRAR